MISNAAQRSHALQLCFEVLEVVDYRKWLVSAKVVYVVGRVVCQECEPFSCYVLQEFCHEEFGRIDICQFLRLKAGRIVAVAGEFSTDRYGFASPAVNPLGSSLSHRSLSVHLYKCHRRPVASSERPPCEAEHEFHRGVALGG